MCAPFPAHDTTLSSTRIRCRNLSERLASATSIWRDWEGCGMPIASRQTPVGVTPRSVALPITCRLRSSKNTLEQLVELAKEGQIALMCAEAVPWRCHRSLIAD